MSSWHLVKCLIAQINIYSHTCTMHRPCTPWHLTHLVPVLWVHLKFSNEVACYLTVALLGCPVEHGVGIFSLLVDSCSKYWGKVFDDLNVPTFCSYMHGIAAILYKVTTQMGGHSKYKFMYRGPRGEAIRRCSHTRQGDSNSGAVLYRGGACKWTGCVKQ